MLTATADVGTPSKAYQAMAARWQLIDDLLGGTATMRAAGNRWLPQETKESDKAYSDRLSRTYLYGALGDTIEKFVSKPFSRHVQVKGKLSDRLAAIEQNADLMGSTITDFASAVFRDGIQHGLSFIFVDYPRTMSEDGKTPSAAEEERIGARPYFQQFHSSTVIGARAKRGADGVLVPTMVRVKETRIEESGAWGEVEKCYVRVYTETYTQEFSKIEGESNWIPGPQIPHKLGKIPIVPFYTRRDGFFCARPPFEDLAWVNLSHYQSSSDQDHILHYARVPILVGFGLTSEETERQEDIGANRFLKFKNPEARIEYVEHGGQAIPSGQKDLEAKEARMEVLGLAPAMENLSGQTATARGIDDSNAKSSIQGWIRSLEGALEQAYVLAAEMVGEKLPEDFKVDIFQDFGIGQRAQQDIVALQQAYTSGAIPLGTFLYELRRRGVLEETTDLEKVEAEASAQGPSLSSMESEPEETPVAA